MQNLRDTERLFVQRQQWFFDTRSSFYWDPSTLEAQVFPLYDDQNPSITAEEITNWLNQLRMAYWDEWLRKFLYVVATNDEWMSDSRKSWILWLWHFMLYNIDTPSGFLLLSMNFTNRSGNKEAMDSWSVWLKKYLNLVSLERMLNWIWKDAVNSWMITSRELYTIRQQLVIPMVQAQFSLFAEDNLH